MWRRCHSWLAVPSRARPRGTFAHVRRFSLCLLPLTCLLRSLWQTAQVSLVWQILLSGDANVHVRLLTSQTATVFRGKLTTSHCSRPCRYHPGKFRDPETSGSSSALTGWSCCGVQERVKMPSAIAGKGRMDVCVRVVVLMAAASQQWPLCRACQSSCG